MTEERYNYLASKAKLTFEEHIELNTIRGHVQLGNIRLAMMRECGGDTQSTPYKKANDYLNRKSKKMSELVPVALANQVLRIIRHWKDMEHG